ncbi:hypothetical protein [Streptomyces alkaliterrae]|uniref:Uncharacterized protein n=1 Tax=Streptomyces alkaliterrae TaxID=2213162 RepID=A0A5P0YXN1_9ACTN|nr:hypothetical protein [Streptomyces alkaliterrae]MBB1256834.1 hypothetical protein [Streptomyces alkaliterrae]MBB1261341.1 hypothetical protein [Streptomyces alkaliterrae]MQS05045.1 hypothetical protein [Streptomyces alkaliterrae]
MSSAFDPQHASVGDVGTALMLVDSRLRSVRDGGSRSDPERQALTEQFVESLGPEEAGEVLEGTCTLIYTFMRWLRLAHEDAGKDVVEYVVPNLVASLRMMPRSVRPEAIPTMVGMVVAAGIGLSPNLWREQYGEWTEAEMTPLEATTFLLAEHINRMTDDPDFAVRLVSEALAGVDER